MCHATLLLLLLVSFASRPGMGLPGPQGNHVITGQEMVTVIRYFECHGPLLLMCPRAGHLGRWLRDLSGEGLSMAAHRGFSPGVLGRTRRDLTFNSFVICALDGSAGSATSALAWAQENLPGRPKLVVVCDGVSCPKLANLTFLDVGNRAFFLNVQDRIVSESYALNGLASTRVVARMEGDSLLRWDEAETVLERRSDLQNSTLLAVILQQEPFVILKDRDHGDPGGGGALVEVPHGTYEGLFIDVLTHLEEDLNFTSKMFTRRDQVWGSMVTHENGSLEWSGMVATLARREVDLVATSLTNTFHR